MEAKKINALEAELKKNRTQSYFFLLLLMVGAFSTAYMFFQLHEANHEIETQNAQLEQQKAQIKEKNDKLKKLNKNLLKLESSNQSFTQRDSLVREIITLVNTSNTPINDLNLTDLSVPQLQAVLKDSKEKVRQYDVKRKSVVKNLFSSNESVRTKARQKLQSQYSVDEKLISDILEEAQDKTDMKNKESYYQMIYLLGQLDGDILKTGKEDLTNIFEKAEKAGLNGTRTKSDIRKIQRKMK